MDPPPVPPSESIRFRTRRRTRWCEEDNQKVLNNAVYLTLLEEARHQYFSDLGLLEQNQFPFLLLQTDVRFLAPGAGGTEVEIELRTTSLARSSFLQVYRVLDVRGERVLCEAEALLVCWDNAHQCKVPMAADFRSKVASFEGLDELG